MNSKINGLSFFKPTLVKLILALVILIIYFLITEICFPWQVEGGGKIYLCGKFLGSFSSVSLTNFILILIATYIIASIIIYLVKKGRK